jgi:outer membrane protein assembly factor BamD (BamD/ComL family)
MRTQLTDIAKKFAAAAKALPDSNLEENAMFRVGECYFFADRYPRANDAYGKLIKKYPNTRHLDVVAARRFEIYRYWLALQKAKPKWLLEPNWTDRTRPRLDTFGNAVKGYDRLRIDDPTGKLADDATMAAANAFFEKGDYARADQLYTDLRDAFPSSEHLFQAHLLGMKCKLMIYQGSDYDGKPLDDAEKLIKSMRRKFRRETTAHREQIDRAHAEVLAKKAERQWQMARYYERRREYGGAKYYYSLITEKYPDTAAGRQARQRLAEIGDLPDRPPQRMAWLVDLIDPPNDDPIVASGGDSSSRR